MKSKHPIHPSERERQRRLESLRASAQQRAIELRDQPEELFSLLALDTPSEEALSQFDQSLEAALDQVERPVAADFQSATPQSSWERSSWGKNLVGWAAAAALAGLAALGVWSQLGDSEAEGVIAATDPVPAESVAVEAMPASKRSIELLDNSNNAQLMDLSVGDMQIVMIFDEDLDL